MEIQFITDAQGKKTAAIIPFDEWERIETACKAGTKSRLR